MPTRILIADDHGVLRAALRALLGDEPGIEVVGEAEDGEAAIDLARRLHPDVLLLDLNMPRVDGIEVTRTLHREQPDLRVLILTVHEDGELLQEALRVGASGYIVKRAAEAELTSALHAVVRGDLYVHPSMMRTLLTETTRAPAPDLATVQTLTPRELQVLTLVAQGYTNREVADALTLSVRTVESHRANLMAKLALSSRADLVHYAKEHGLIG